MNTVESSQEMQVKRDVRDVCMPIGLVYEALVKTGLLKNGQEKEEEKMNWEECLCQYHEKTMDHSIQECPEFLKMVQVMMNDGEIELWKSKGVKCERFARRSDVSKLQVHNIVSSNKVISKVSFPRGLDKTSTKIIVNL